VTDQELINLIHQERALAASRKALRDAAPRMAELLRSARKTADSETGKDIDKLFREIDNAAS